MVEAPNRIAEWRKKRGMTQQQLADAIGAHWITVSKLERGKMQLTFEWSEKIADALRVYASRLQYKEDTKATIYVGALIVDGHQTGLKSEEDLPLAIKTHLKATGPDVWSLVADDSLYPIFRRGDLLRLEVILGFDDDPLQNYATYVGRLCLIRPIGLMKHIIAILEAGEKKGFYTARSLTGPPIVNIEIEILAVVTQAFFQPDLTGELEAELEV